MIGLIITTKGTLASVLKETCEYNNGPMTCVTAVNGLNDSKDELTERLKAAVEGMRQECEGILFLTESYKSDACKAAMEIADQYAKYIRMEVLSGVNTDMIEEIIGARSFIKELDTLCGFAAEAGKRYIIWTSSNDRNSPLLVREEEE